MSELILVSDIGSTTTKLLLLENTRSSFRFTAGTTAGTTVEKPVENVCEGFFKGVLEIEKTAGITLTDKDCNLKVPFHTTSSAGGGLQILVIALTASDSGAIAGSVAYTAGGVILDSFAIDDDLPRVEKIRRMKHLSPDLVIMAGGYEGGAISGLVNMAQLVSIANPRPKFGTGKLPMVFCGNTEARPFLEGILKEHFEITWADNIRPDGLNFNLKPSVEKVHDLFMNHVMQMAPGYSRLSALTSSPIIPTPAGVKKILSLYSKEKGENVVMADMGGATTDIFSHVNGEFQRTVAANTGMSYSLSNIVCEAGAEAVFRHIPGVSYENAENWVLGKTLFPTTVPGCSTAELVESAAAAEGMRLAWKHHLEISYRRKKVGFTERLRLLGRCRFDETFKTVDDHSFRSSDITVIIGAGGIMAHSSPRRAAWILACGFRPKGLTMLMVDKHFQSPHMGVLSRHYPDKALRYWKEECLAKVARVYAPVKKCRNLGVSTPEGKITVSAGECVYLENSQGVSISGVTIPQDDIPLIIDMRFGEEVIPLDFRNETEHGMAPNLPARNTVAPAEETVCKEFNLSYRGEILVSEGDTVQPGSVLGVNRLIPPRIYFVDVRKALGYQREDISDSDVMAGITVKPGDRVRTGDTVCRLLKGQGFSSYRAKVESPVRGEVTSVTEPGLIIMKEIQDYDGKPHAVNVAKILGVKPRRILANMKVRKGDFVQKDQVIAAGERLSRIKSPATGTIIDVNKKTGIVTVQYVLDPVQMKSPMAGRVKKVLPGLSVTLASSGISLNGVVGFGPVRWGPLKVDAPERGCIMLLNHSLTRDDIREYTEAGVSGVIVPSVSSVPLVELLDGEPGVILTGDESIPFSLVVLRGIGKQALEPEIFSRMSSYSGCNCILFTTTRIRAGVERPQVLIQPEGE